MIFDSAKIRAVLLFATAAQFIGASSANAIYLDGEGHYSLQAGTETAPGVVGNNGMYQATRQNFRLLGEARLNEKSSVFLEFRLFDPRTSYLGDKNRPRHCNSGYTVEKDENGNKKYVENDSCDSWPQDTGEPGYEPYTPKVTQIYARYAFEYCLLDVGRRGRDWGMGLFLSSGKGAFDQDASVFDGVTCNVNLQKSQTLAFSVGLDKLSETGNDLNNPFNLPTPAQPTAGTPDESYTDRQNYEARKKKGSAAMNSDDLEQYFLTIEFDDRKANAGSTFTKDIGFYFSNIVGHDGGTDIKFLDLYTGFYISDLVFRNEVIFRLGKTVDPNWIRLGGKYDYDPEDPTKLYPNKVQSIGFGGQFDYTLTRSGSFVGPPEYNKGDASRHAILLDYAYAPGDSDGYKDVTDTSKRDNNTVTAMGFHRNYKPALIMFNGHSELSSMHVDGVFDADRVMNVTILGLGYRYESIATGNFDVKFLTATLDQRIPAEVKAAYADSETRPIGYAGRALGYEMDLKYGKSIGRDLDLGLAAGVLLPGKAWQTERDNTVSTDLMLQSSVAFKF